MWCPKGYRPSKGDGGLLRSQQRAVQAATLEGPTSGNESRNEVTGCQSMKQKPSQEGASGESRTESGDGARWCQD